MNPGKEISCPNDEFRKWHESVIAQYPHPIQQELRTAREKFFGNECCKAGKKS